MALESMPLFEVLNERQAMMKLQAQMKDIKLSLWQKDMN
jgi:hypothetical protein